MAELTVGAFLARCARAGFAYGVLDCLLMPGDWVLLRRGVDYGAPWRGRYSTAIGCARILRQEGGVVSLLDGCAARAGIERTAEPRVGDVGAVRALTDMGDGLVGAIRTSVGWAALTPSGLRVGQARCVAAWRI